VGTGVGKWDFSDWGFMMTKTIENENGIEMSYEKSNMIKPF
jgi:hypothetical protein